ncbi:MAG: hypothetical protein M1824_005259 [Vezdaea acicularis]|nr:MAG: hypothetical protein M1824_005259 [Vezdaea acicularis]
MAPLSKAARAEKANTVTKLLTFTAELSAQLQDPASDPSLIRDLERNLELLPFGPNAAVAAKHQELDAEGTRIWNLVARVERDGGDRGRVGCLARTFAFLLLDCACGSVRASLINMVRVLKVGLKCSRHCLAHKETELGLRVLERAAQHESDFAKAVDDLATSSEDKTLYRRLSTSYFMERTALSWRMFRFDVAEHMYSKVAAMVKDVDSNTAENIADLLYEIGRERLEKKEYAMANTWLERSHSVLASQDLERLSAEAGELRLCVLQASVKALLGLEDLAATARAKDLITLLETDYGDKLVVSLLKLESLRSSPDFDGDDYYRVVQQIIGKLILTESSFKMVLQHIHHLKDKSVDLACRALDSLMVKRLFESENDDWIEKVFVTRLWMTVSATETSGNTQSLVALVNELSSKLQKPLSASATHASQIVRDLNPSRRPEANTLQLLWKLIELNYTQGQFAAAEAWCKLALHKVFENSGELNAAKISRKLILCSLSREDFGSAKIIFNQMSDSGRQAPMTRYLMFKASVRSGDEDTESKASNSEAVASICKLFEGATVQAKTSRRNDPAQIDQLFSIDELDWFSRTSYNLALESCADWEGSMVLKLLHSCIGFIDLYPSDMPKDTILDLSLRRMFCDFLAISLLIALARSEDNIEKQLQYYLTGRAHVEGFRARIPDQLTRLGPGSREDLLKKLGVVLAFDFEAAVRLKSWDSLELIIEECAAANEPRIYETLADIMLSSGGPSATVVMTLQNIINMTAQHYPLSIDKISRWIRCLFQLAVVQDTHIAEQLLDQAARVAHDTRLNATPPYPEEELEWLSTTAFNRGVDFYCASDDESCRRWAEKAIGVAGEMSEKRVREVLMDKFLRMSGVE